MGKMVIAECALEKALDATGTGGANGNDRDYTRVMRPTTIASDWKGNNLWNDGANDAGSTTVWPRSNERRANIILLRCAINSRPRLPEI